MCTKYTKKQGVNEVFLKFLYGLVAGICDLYFLAFITGTIEAIGTVLFKEPVPVWLLIVNFFACILASVLYHIFLASRVTWLTPGELIVGKKIISGVKEWQNPYQRNRLVFFLIALFSIVIAGNVWDNLGSGAIYRFAQVIISAAPVAMLYYGLADMGQGKLKSVIYPIAYFVIELLTLLNSPVTDTGIKSFLIISTGVIIIIYILIAGAYHLFRQPENIVSS